VKKTLTILVLVLLPAAIAGLAAEDAAKESAADILIARISADYSKALEDADAIYAKSAAPVLKRYAHSRDQKILTAGNNAIRRLTSARKRASELDGVRMEQEIEKIRKSLDERIGDAPKVLPRTPAPEACGASFKGHTYLAIALKTNWKEAAAMCKKMGGHLAYLETEEELAFITKTFPNLRLWVGATDAHKEGDWRWGNRKPVARTLWSKVEPSRLAGENYALVFDGKDRMLHDVTVNHSGVGGFLCEWE